MLVVVVGVVSLLVLAIVVALVLKEAHRLGVEPPEAVYDPVEALDWVVRNVAADIAATLTIDDVRQILDLQVQYLRVRSVSGNGSSAHTPGPIIFGGAETVDYILERAMALGSNFTSEQVYAVVETQLEYLRSIGAVGPPA